MNLFISTFKVLHEWKRKLFGVPIRLSDRKKEALGKFRALSVLSSDALSSVAYASEEILLILASLGSVMFFLNFWISAAIIGLMFIIVMSYTQTINAYPHGGGAYTVCRENLGERFSLLAASSLLLDYILTVSVSISAGVLAITSMVPEWQHLSVTIACGAVFVIVILNLRGVRESGAIFSLPTYGFIVAIVWMGIQSFFVPPFDIVADTSNIFPEITVFLLLRAFSGGCTALTGIEAISNGVSIFKEPRSRNAIITLLMMGTILALLFFSISYLCFKYHIFPKANESVLSQIAHTVFGGGIQYQAVQILTALILVLAANTSFADFPRLSSLLARDGYLPKQLMHTGDRLAFSNGIILLGVISGLLIILFKADTHLLIPLYAIGVFMSFTLSQAGMVIHWAKTNKYKMMINGFGACCCMVTLVVVSISKFLEGAWIVFIILPIFMHMFYVIKNHYQRIDQELEIDGQDLVSLQTRSAPNKRHFKVIIPIKKLNKGVLKAIQFSGFFSKDVVLLKIEHDLMNADSYVEKRNLEKIVQKFDLHLEVINSQYRSLLSPILDYIEETENNLENQELIIVLPEFVTQKYWHSLLHNHFAFWLKTFLIQQRKKRGSTRIIIDIPYYVEG